MKRCLLLLLPLVAGLLTLGPEPARATGGETWTVRSVDVVGCSSGDWDLTVVFSGVDGSTYVPHTTVTSGGLVYMDEDASFAPTDGVAEHWGLIADDSYGPTTGAYPIPAGQPMQVTFSLERPKGHVLYSWSMIARSCDSKELLLDGPDLDQDLVLNPVDRCPALQAPTDNGCPLRDRTLALGVRHGPKRVVGRLAAAGCPALYAGRKVTVWKKRPGPDKLVARRTTDPLGRFRIRVGKGRYYATSPAALAPTEGIATADTSRTVRVR